MSKKYRTKPRSCKVCKKSFEPVTRWHLVCHPCVNRLSRKK